MGAMDSFETVKNAAVAPLPTAFCGSNCNPGDSMRTPNANGARQGPMRRQRGLAGLVPQ